MFSEKTVSQVNDTCWSKLEKFAVQRRFIDDAYYQPGNKLCQSVLGKKSVVIFDNEDFLHQQTEKFRCHVPACMKVFETLISFEDHYNTQHRYVCDTCHKRLPSPHLLDLHISETHDSYFAALAERKPMFQCFVESCNLRFSDKKERRSHCIEVHKFPPDFRYDSSKNGEKKKKIVQTDSSASTSKPGRMLGFGHTSNRGFFRNRGRGGTHRSDRKPRSTNEGEVSMADLEDALPSME
ncbi:zinc finger protein 511-like [Daphnia carinata]|uniref:zinc finger protein 511-like n=1 Tax=Daphnia carinata TaxID=120202 RepID=UPI00257FADFC|nr:zinc finger protein 511-like [Daphnia carinata]